MKIVKIVRAFFQKSVMIRVDKSSKQINQYLQEAREMKRLTKEQIKELEGIGKLLAEKLNESMSDEFNARSFDFQEDQMHYAYEMVRQSVRDNI